MKYNNIKIKWILNKQYFFLTVVFRKIYPNKLNKKNNVLNFCILIKFFFVYFLDIKFYFSYLIYLFTFLILFWRV